MRKHLFLILATVSIMSFTVSARPSKDDVKTHATVAKAKVELPSANFDIAIIDHTVPLVQGIRLVHVESIARLSVGFLPERVGRARAPTVSSQSKKSGDRASPAV